jgi:hypothetical protein
LVNIFLKKLMFVVLIALGIEANYRVVLKARPAYLPLAVKAGNARKDTK